MLKELANVIIRKIKNDPEYAIDESVGSSTAVLMVMFRTISLVRGFVFQLLHFRKPVLLFLGKRTSIRYSRMLTLNGTTTIGNSVTLECLGIKGIVIGDNVNIPDGCFIRCSGVITDIGIGVVLGDNTGLGHYNFINGQGGVVIEDSVIIGPYVKLLSENHNFDRMDVLIRQQGVKRVGIHIESDVWIGSSVTVLDGVRIGRGSIIGAGSVVTKSIPEFSVALGVPCKVIKKRE